MSSDDWSVPSKSAGSGPNPPSSEKPKPVRLKLETSRDLHKALARLIRAALGGVIDTADLGRYANAIATLHRIVTDGELAVITARLDALEQRDAA
jgi:hypothetical protein